MSRVVAAIVASWACACAAPVKRPPLDLIDGEPVVGSILEIGAELVRLERIHREGSLRMYELSVVRPNEPARPFCLPDAQRERWAIPVVGAGQRVSFVCSSGAIGKCIRWGYPPDGEHAELHQACVRMVRADYGGDGRSHTRDGTLIAFCDLAGVHPCAQQDVEIEAAWSATGATCVARPRIPELVSLTELERRYPRLAGHLGTACTIGAASADPTTKLFTAVPARR